jgi:hypothetical protein
MTNSPGLVSESCHESTFKLIHHHKLYFQAWHLGHSTNTIILKSNEHKSYDRVFDVICTGPGCSKYWSKWGSPTHIPDRWRMCTISYSIPRWRTATSCGQSGSSKMIYYAEMHQQTVEKQVFFPLYNLCLEMNPIWFYKGS